MTANSALKSLFSLILITMLSVTTWASFQQPVWNWGGLSGVNAAWTWATLADAFGGFLTFYAWVFYRERAVISRALWLIGILLLGNIAMSSYVLIALYQLPKGSTMENLLLRKTP